jgi:hypothetical protein
LQAVLARLKRPGISERAQSWPPASVVHVISLTVGYFLLLWLNRDQWFSGDDWFFLTDRLFGPGTPGLLEPSNEHWSTIPILIYRGLYSLVGARTYLPYVAVALILHVGVAHLLWRVMRHSDVEPWIATGASAMFLFFGAGAGNILWAFQMGFIGPLLLGLGHVLLVDHGGTFDRRDVAGWGLSLTSLMFSTIAVPMTAVAGIVALIRRGWRASLMTVAPAATVYLVWVFAVGREALADDAPTVGTLMRLPLYVAIGVRETVQGIATTELGVALLLPVLFLLGALGWMRRRSSPAAPVACAVGPFLLFTLTGIGRVSFFGVGQAGSSRYVYVAGALLLPLVALGLTSIARVSSLARIAVLLFVSYAVITNFRILQGEAEGEARREQFNKELAIAAALPSSPGPILEATIAAPYLGMNAPAPVRVEDLVALRVDGAFPEIRISPEVRLQAAVYLQVSLSAQPRLASDDRSAVLVAGAPHLISDGCVSFGPSPTLQRPTAVVGVSEPASLGIRSDVAGEIEVLIHRDGTVTPLPRTFGLPEGRTSFLNLGVVGSEAIVRLSPIGETTLCNLRPP